LLRKISVVVFLLCLGAALWWLYAHREEIAYQEPAYGGAFSLTDMNGKIITQTAFIGQPSLVFFGFTNCPEICPTTLVEMKNWFDTLGVEGQKLKAFLITTDPERDTPQVLKTYISNITDSVVGITGSPADIAAVQKAWGVYVKNTHAHYGDNMINHTASVFLIGSQGQLYGTIAYGENSDIALQKIKRLIRK
jgi:protein SCO1